MRKAYVVLYTVYFYDEVDKELFVMKHINGLTFADSLAEACQELEHEYTDAERIDIQAFDSYFEIPDDKMEMVKEMLMA